MNEDRVSKQIVTPKARIAFPHLFEKEVFDDNSKPVYSVTFLFPKDTDMGPLKKAAALAVEEKWGNKIPKGLKTPFKDGDAVDEHGELLYPYDGFENCYFLKATSEYDPGIVDQKTVAIHDPDVVYGGCYGRGYLQAFTYDRKTSKGVSFALIHFQKLEEGERFANRVSAQEAFDDELSDKSDAAKAFEDDDASDIFGL